MWEKVYHDNKGIVMPENPQEPFAKASEVVAPAPLTITNRITRFIPKSPDSKSSVSYPKSFDSICAQLSDVWSNILVETGQNIQTLLMCGSTHSEGNTFVSFHLAMFLSKEYNLKILYMDLNQKHSAIPQLKNLPGVYSYLYQGKDPSSLIVKTEYPGLYLLPSGMNNGVGILPGEYLDPLISFCRDNFGVTIIDGQPITTSPSMIELAKLVDFTALVCRYGFSRREVSSLAVEKLKKFGVHSLGAILNARQFPIPPSLYRMMG